MYYSRFGKERYTCEHLKAHLNSIVKMLLLCTLNIITKKTFNLLFLRHYLTLSMQVTRCTDCFVLKIITKYNQTSNPRSLHYTWLYNVGEFPKDHFKKHNYLFICISIKWRN